MGKRGTFKDYIILPTDEFGKGKPNNIKASFILKESQRVFILG